jgi:hypothetical protein
MGGCFGRPRYHGDRYHGSYPRGQSRYGYGNSQGRYGYGSSQGRYGNTSYPRDDYSYGQQGRYGGDYLDERRGPIVPVTTTYGTGYYENPEAVTVYA